jgi:predicted lactoylglutathione lyase
MDDLRMPLANIITLGVQDFQRERQFYRDLGWSTAFDSDDFVVFALRGSLLALFPADKLAVDANAAPSEAGDGGIRFSIIISVDSAAQVDQFIEVVREAGGRISKEPTDAEFFTGRDAYFADPEGNYWEVAWAPRDNPVSIAARRAAGLPDQIRLVVTRVADAA